MKYWIQFEHIHIYWEAFSMGKIYQGMTELIGGTPLLQANNFMREKDFQATLLVKLEYFNPA